ncbi:MAG: hypothetical protein U0797_30480 [Gemmataceae bacterium]
MRTSTTALGRCGLLALLVTLSSAATSSARGDVFDHYNNPALARLTEGKNARELKRLTPSDVVEHDRVLPGHTSAFLVVRTNGGRLAKLLVQAGKQKIDAERAVPILSIERFVTFKEGEVQTRLATGANQSLYAGFRFSLDLGQVVPEALGGDLRFVVEGDKVYAEPVGKARLYVVTQHDPSTAPRKGGKFVMGSRFSADYFNGTFRLHDDGRRSGKLVLKVDEERRVSGAYYSDKDGQRYEVTGKVGSPPHAVEFTVKLPRTEQTFRGMLFTGDGRAIAGTSKLADRESAFYATREP